MQAPDAKVTESAGKYKTEFAVKVVASEIKLAELSILPVMAAMTESSVNWIAVNPSVPFVVAPVPFTYTHPLAPMLFNMFIPLSPMIFM